MGPTKRDAKTATQKKNRRRHEETANPKYQESAYRSIQASGVRKKNDWLRRGEILQSSNREKTENTEDSRGIRAT